MSKTTPSGSGRAVCEKLCLECGLCCNGTIFADVKLESGDNATRLRWLGVPVRAARSDGAKPCFLQPCAALNGCHCKIYAERPRYCRNFDCLLLKQVKAGETTPARALKLVHKARAQAEEAREYLRELGDKDETVALGMRFRRMTQKLEAHFPGQEKARVYGRLTLAMHDLNLQLAESFYPEPAGPSGR